MQLPILRLSLKTDSLVKPAGPNGNLLVRTGNFAKPGPWTIQPRPYGPEENEVPMQCQLMKENDGCSPYEDAMRNWFGKSACYILLPLIMKNMHKRHFYAIIVSPLRSLMNDQVRQLANIGINAVICGPDNSAEEQKGGSNTVCSRYLHFLDMLSPLMITYTAYDIFNADETAIFYRALPEKTLELKSIACQGGKASKERLPVMVCTNVSGTEIITLFDALSAATCTNNVRLALIQKLQLQPGIQVEWEVPDRPNIHMEIKCESGMD
ncbi:hypothetical protein DPMN_086858 [Dreissena polymorpha]|uniref:Uncharacterized protein n=1 Tax=Dreissena polymorpha TaxID=45954 RepID=A0A9D4KRX4_DREPO|nr:hypothetical protein DPMN_086858 [Dreissena polymorpha]